MLQVLPVGWKGKIYELGSGWGGLALRLSKKYPDAEVVAIELSLVPFIVSFLRKALTGAKNLKIYRQDFYQSSINDAGAIFCYLYPGAMKKLSPKFKEELKGVVISNSFALPGWKESKILYAPDLSATKIYVYS